jgi:hypothetical protein
MTKCKTRYCNPGFRQVDIPVKETTLSGGSFQPIRTGGSNGSGTGTNQVLILLFGLKTINLSHRFVLIGIRVLDFNSIRIMDNAVEDGISQSGF